MSASGARRFEGRVAFVTGGSSGIGLATAQRLHAEGAHVIIAARREDQGRAAAETIGAGAVFVALDVRERDAVHATIDRVVERHGRLDVLVNAAGVLVVAPTLSLQEKHWQRTIDINLNGVFHTCQAALPHLRTTVAAGLAPQTAIVNVVSIDAVAGDRGFAAYNAAKAGALNLSRSLALEFAADRVRVNAVSPGVVDTPMAAASTSDEASHAAFRAAVPVGRVGQPHEIAAAIAFLAADEASFVVGANLVVDGGVTAGTGHPDALALLR